MGNLYADRTAGPAGWDLMELPPSWAFTNWPEIHPEAHERMSIECSPFRSQSLYARFQILDPSTR
jgi:hypothetical protein